MGEQAPSIVPPAGAGPALRSDPPPRARYEAGVIAIAGGEWPLVQFSYSDTT